MRCHERGNLGANRRCGRIGDDVSSAQRIEREIFRPRKLVGAVHDCHEPLGKHGYKSEIGFVVDVGRERELVAVALEVFQQRLREALENVDLRVFSVLVAIAFNKRWEVVALDGINRSNVDASCWRPCVLVSQRDTLFKCVHRFGGVLVELFSIFRELDFAPFALEEGNAQFAFELRYGVGKRRLRYEQLFRGMSVVLHFSEFAEVIQLRKVHDAPFLGF